MPDNRPTRSAAALVAAVLLLSTASDAEAQVQASEKGRSFQVISGTEIELEYYRPSVRGRSPIFGGIVHWGEVWTPGANYATTLRLSKEITLNGVALPPGKYGLWIQVLEAEPWTLVVHADTLRGHGNHPAVEDGLFRIPVEPTESPAFVETLTFTVDQVRLASAELQLNWGNVRVPMALGIDPGIVTTLTEEEAAALAGEWLYDDTPSLPSREKVEEWVTGAEARKEGAGAELRGYYDALFALERPRPVRFDRDASTGVVSRVDPVSDAMTESLYTPEEMEEIGAWAQILLPRGEGIFMIGYARGGELSEFDPKWASMIEFEFDEAGRAVRFTERDSEDAVQGTGVRR